MENPLPIPFSINPALSGTPWTFGNIDGIEEQARVDVLQLQGLALSFDAPSARTTGERHAQQLPPLPLRAAPPHSSEASARMDNLPRELLQKVNEFLLPQELATVALTTVKNRREVRLDIRYIEARQFREARKQWRVSADEPARISAHNAFIETCNAIARAREARGEPNALWPAFNEARRLGESANAVISYASEKLLFEAAAAVGSMTAVFLVDVICAVRIAAKSPEDPSALDNAIRTLRHWATKLQNDLAVASTADLRRPGDNLPRRFTHHPTAYIEHFADEGFEPGDVIEQSHTFADGRVATSRGARPAPEAGESMLRFHFGPPGGYVHRYVHVFNLPRVAIDMDAPD